jgi:hypothetical protein
MRMNANIRYFRSFPYLLIVVFCIGGGILSIALGPDRSWDLRNYHLYGPFAYMHGRYLYDVGPAQIQSFFNPTGDLILYALISSSLNDFPRVVAFILGAIHGVNGALIAGIAGHVLRPADVIDSVSLKAIAVVIGLTGVGTISVLGTSTGDLLTSAFILASLLAALKLTDRARRGRARYFVIAGIMAGIGIGLKYTSAIYFPGVSLILAAATFRHKSATGLIAFGVSVVLSFFAISAPHLLTLWCSFGNPLFPSLNTIFKSPYFDPTNLRDVRFLPRDIWQIVAYPFFWSERNTLVTELTFRDLRGAIEYLAVVLGLALAVCRLRDCWRGEGPFAHTRGLLLVFAFVVASYMFWMLIFGIYRYFVTIEMLSGVVTVGTVLWYCENRWGRLTLSLATLTICVTTTLYLSWGRGTFGNKYVDVRVPNLPDKSIVLIVGDEPLAYVVPFANPSTRFLGIENNYLRLSQTNLLARRVRELMRNPQEQRYLLTVPGPDRGTSNVLAFLGLRAQTRCMPIESNLEERQLTLCPLEPK